MIRIKVCSPILFFIFLLFISCKKDEAGLQQNYYGLMKKGELAYADQRYDSAFYYYFNAKEVFRDSKNDGNKELAIYALLRMADSQNRVSDFSGVEETVTEAIAVKENTIYRDNLENIYAIVYKERGDYDNALKVYDTLLKNTDNVLYRQILINNIAVTYLEKKQYQKAADHLKPITTNDTLIRHKDQFAKVLDNLGYAYFKLNHPDALHYLNDGMKIRDSLNDDYEKTPSLIHLAEYYQKNDPTLSKEFALKAYRSATAVNNPDDRLEALDFLIKNSEGNKAKSYYLIYHSLNDSIAIVRQSAKNQFAKIKYDSSTALKNFEIQKGRTSTLLMLFVSVVLLSTLLYFLIRNRNREKLKTISYETETRISKKLHDELANDVYNALTFVETQDFKNPDKKETLLDRLDTIYTRTRNISKENSTIDTGEKFVADLKEMMSGFITKERNVIIKNDASIQWSKIAAEKKIAVYRVLQELLVNMKKHSRSTLVVINFINGPETINIDYSDNGIGCAEITYSANGLRNAENRIHTIKGKITFESESGKGFRSKIVFPK